MDAHLVLRNSRQLADQDPGLIGNLLIERLIGAHIYQASWRKLCQAILLCVIAVLETQS